jgi:amino acid adenylation domain-containing protein
MGLMLKEVDVLYRLGQHSLPKLAIHYADYALYQRDVFQQGGMQAQFDYWQKKLQGVTVLELPTDYKRPKIQTFNGDRLDFSLTEALSMKVNAVCQQQQVSSFMFFLSCLNILLYRYTEQQDMCIGTPIAGRNLQATENMIGLFVNTLALRNQISSDISASELLTQIKKTTLEAYAHQDAPFDQIVEHLQLARNLSTTPVFQVMLSMQNSLIDELQFSGLVIKPQTINNPTAKFDLLLDIGERDDHYQLQFEYNTDLFKLHTIERNQKHFVSIVEWFCQTLEQSNQLHHPSQSLSIGSVDFLTDNEKDQLLYGYNKTEKDFISEYGLADNATSLCQLMTQQAINTPDNIALIFDGQSLSYRQLDQQSNQLAHYLLAKGVKPDDIVAISVERSLSLLVTLLAIMKSGAAYLPLDPDYPNERLEYILSDSGAKLLLTHSTLIAHFSTTVEMICIDHIASELTQYSLDSLDLRTLYSQKIIDQSLAYVIYTSGSTGLPKGVCIEQQNLSNFLLSMIQQPAIQEDDSLLAVTSTSFDIHTLELYAPLLTGGCVVMASQDMIRDAVALETVLTEQPITIMQATPATWKMLLANGWQAARPMKVLCGGEALTDTLKTQLLSQDNIELWNMYGPTETTVWSSVQKMTVDQSRITIGHPIANTTFYIFDAQRNLVPIGVSGELYIGGRGVTRGYLNGKIDRTELTRKQFIDYTFESGQSQRLYRTGDECRYDDEGQLEVLGRLDSQIKLNGYRIELGEIESLLTAHDEIQEAVLMVKTDANEVNQLVAYLCTHNTITLVECEKKSEQFKQYLREKLPSYMVPSFFVYLDELPLTPNGKIDKKALPEVSLSQSLKKTYQAAETETEKAMLLMWSEVLMVESIGITDDFFALGGNSLQAAQIIARIRSQYQIEVPVKSLFTEPTIKALSRLIDTQLSAGNLIKEESIQTGLYTQSDVSFEQNNEEDYDDDDEEFEL